MRSLLPSAALVITTLLCAGTDVRAQDIRVRIGTYFGGGVAREFNANCTTPCNSDSQASTSVDRVVVDATGNIFVAGTTNAIDFPVTTSAFSKTVNYTCNRSGTCDSSDGFVAKFNSAGQLQWSTYTGALRQNGSVSTVLALALDTSGNVVLAGAGNADLCWNYTWMMKISSTGSSRTYTNTLNCNDNLLGTIANAAAIDPSGRYIYWNVYDSDGLYPITTGANHADSNFPQGRLIKIDSQKTTNGGIVYSAGTTATYNPDTQQVTLSSVAVNSSGNAFILSSDTRVTKFDSVGAVLFSVKYLPSWATGSTGNAITTTGAGDILFTAQVSPQGAYPATSSFGTITSGSFRHRCTGGSAERNNGQSHLFDCDP